MSGRLFRVALTTTVVAIGTLTAAGAAVAAASPSVAPSVTPSVSLHAVADRITAGTAPKFTYTTTGLPSGSTVQLQRQTGSTWTTVATPPAGTNRSVTAPVLSSLGKYVYRMQAVKNGAVVARTPHTHAIYAYGTTHVRDVCVPMGHCVKNRTQVGSAEYISGMAIGSGTYPGYFAGATLAKTSCRSFSFAFTNAHNATAKSYLKIVQPGHPDQKASADRSHLGQLHATLTGGRFFIDAATGDGSSLFIGGTASCWTIRGTY